MNSGLLSVLTGDLFSLFCNRNVLPLLSIQTIQCRFWAQLRCCGLLFQTSTSVHLYIYTVNRLIHWERFATRPMQTKPLLLHQAEQGKLPCSGITSNCEQRFVILLPPLLWADLLEFSLGKLPQAAEIYCPPSPSRSLPLVFRMELLLRRERHSR